jgi:hypothetical protein
VELKHHLLIHDNDLEISNLSYNENSKDAMAIGDLTVIIAAHGIEDTLTPLRKVFLANSTVLPSNDITLFDKLISTPRFVITDKY